MISIFSRPVVSSMPELSNSMQITGFLSAVKVFAANISCLGKVFSLFKCNECSKGLAKDSILIEKYWSSLTVSSPIMGLLAKE